MHARELQAGLEAARLGAVAIFSPEGAAVAPLLPPAEVLPGRSLSRFLLISGRRIHHSTRPPQALAGEGTGAGEVGEVELAGADGTGNAPLVSGRQAARRQEEGTANPLVR
jgi:hypothetical protein